MMGSALNRASLPRLGRVLLAAALGATSSGAAMAGVTREGAWPEAEPAVSLEVAGVPRSEAVKRLAREAGWSIVFHAPPGDPVDVHVTDQPAGKVLDLLLAGADYVASRDGSLISITAAKGMLDGPEPPAPLALPSAPSLVPLPPRPLEAGTGDEERGRDRAITGSSLRIEKGEIVHDVSVVGGSLDVHGQVTGDVVVMGGSARIREGASVAGDISTMGGSVTLEDGVRVGGDVEVVGGSLKRGSDTVIGGDVKAGPRPRASGGGGPRATTASELASDAGSAVTRTALLFAFGAVLLALWPRRVELLKIDIASRPMRSFALGVLGALGGSLLFVALCVTVVGIPFAVIGLLLGFVAAAAGVCAVLETAGAGVLGHRTRNPYVHLAAGCLALLVLGAIPYVGNFVYAAVILVSLGALVSTRATGLIRTRRGEALAGAHPFRAAP